MLKYMLDTNIVIYVLKRRPIELLARFNANTNRMAISVITLSELLHGVEKSTSQEKNLQVVEDFISRISVLDYDAKASAHYGHIRAGLERNGTPIGINDLHIAGHARSAGLILVTNNRKEFDRVPGLIVENWLDN
ncbi:type II toxin-antitoxin system tRNA(fMet)-specific endonuclease VapC [Thorsellia kenyensis]|uniref:Ribonuclease VapC n=1 Tax=Thorsellia kenyensis TaxID=1549888 RepID=A0ABV6CAX9_9GAMM